MTVKVFLTVSYLWLTFTTLANGQYNVPGNFFTPQSQPPGNPFSQPNGQQNFFPPGGKVPGNPFPQPNGQQSFFPPGGKVPGNPFPQPNGQQNFFPPGGKVPGNPFPQPNGQQNFFPQGGKVPGNLFTQPNSQQNFPGGQVTNPQNVPNSNTFPPQRFNTPSFMDISSLLPPGFIAFPVYPPTSPEPQNPASYNPTFAPQSSNPSFSYPQKTSPINTGPRDPSSISPNLQPRDSFPTRPQQNSPLIPQIINPSAFRDQSPNPSFTAPQQPSPSYSSPLETFPTSSVPQQTYPDSPSPRQILHGPRGPQQAYPDSPSPQQIPQDPRGPQQTIIDSTGPQQSNSVPPTVPQQSNSDSTSPQQIPQDPNGPQQTNTDSTGPQQSNSAPPTVPQPTDSGTTVPQTTDSGSTVPQTTDSGSTVPQTTDSGSTVPQQTDSYPSGPVTTNSGSDSGQPITSASEPSSSVSKAPQDPGSMPTVPQYPSHRRASYTKYRSRSGKEMDSQPARDPLKGLRIVCIFNNKHYYKNGFTPAQLEPHLCTHLNYEFAILDPKTFEMMTSEPYLDVELRFYEEAVGLKHVNPELKVMLSLGGWTDSTKKYSDMAADPVKRRNFVQKCIPFLKDHGFDGMDLAWEYPNCWQGATDVSPKDKANFVVLLRELRQEFDKNGLILSVSVGAVKKEVDAAYDVPEVSNTVHYINVMTYDMHGSWEKKTSHHVQFEAMPGDEDKYCNVKGGMQIWVEKGASKKKLNMGLAFYARTSTMTNSKQCRLNLPAIGPGDPGPVSKEGGILSYHEMCNFLNAGNWTEKEDKQAGFYACCGDQFAAYDNAMMLVRKAKFVVEGGYGGVLLKDLSGDDSKGECFNMPFPLLKMVRLEMIHKVKQKYS